MPSPSDSKAWPLVPFPLTFNCAAPIELDTILNNSWSSAVNLGSMCEVSTNDNVSPEVIVYDVGVPAPSDAVHEP